jgi:hypothetical protein
MDNSARIMAQAATRAALTGSPFETLVEAVQKAEIASFLADCEQRRHTEVQPSPRPSPGISCSTLQ